MTKTVRTHGVVANLSVRNDGYVRGVVKFKADVINTCTSATRRKTALKKIAKIVNELKNKSDV